MPDSLSNEDKLDEATRLLIDAARREMSQIDGSTARDAHTVLKRHYRGSRKQDALQVASGLHVFERALGDRAKAVASEVTGRSILEEASLAGLGERGCKRSEAFPSAGGPDCPRACMQGSGSTSYGFSVHRVLGLQQEARLRRTLAELSGALKHSVSPVQLDTNGMGWHMSFIYLCCLTAASKRKAHVAMADAKRRGLFSPQRVTFNRYLTHAFTHTRTHAHPHVCMHARMCTRACMHARMRAHAARRPCAHHTEHRCSEWCSTGISAA